MWSIDADHEFRERGWILSVLERARFQPSGGRTQWWPALYTSFCPSLQKRLLSVRRTESIQSCWTVSETLSSSRSIILFLGWLLRRPFVKFGTLVQRTAFHFNRMCKSPYTRMCQLTQKTLPFPSSIFYFT